MSWKLSYQQPQGSYGYGTGLLTGGAFDRNHEGFTSSYTIRQSADSSSLRSTNLAGDVGGSSSYYGQAQSHGYSDPYEDVDHWAYGQMNDIAKGATGVLSLVGNVRSSMLYQEAHQWSRTQHRPPFKPIKSGPELRRCLTPVRQRDLFLGDIKNRLDGIIEEYYRATTPATKHDEWPLRRVLDWIAAQRRPIKGDQGQKLLQIEQDMFLTLGWHLEEMDAITDLVTAFTRGDEVVAPLAHIWQQIQKLALTTRHYRATESTFRVTRMIGECQDPALESLAGRIAHLQHEVETAMYTGLSDSGRPQLSQLSLYLSVPPEIKASIKEIEWAELRSCNLMSKSASGNARLKQQYQTRATRRLRRVKSDFTGQFVGPETRKTAGGTACAS